MSWFLIDDNLAELPEIVSIPKRYRLPVIGLFAAVGTYMSRHETGGVVSIEIVERYGGYDTLIDFLFEGGFWRHPHGVDGPVDSEVEFTGKGCRVGSREGARKAKESNAERQRRYRQNQKAKRSDQSKPENVTPLRDANVTGGVTGGTGTYPLPTQTELGYVESSPNVSNARDLAPPRREDEPENLPAVQDDTWALATSERNGLSAPVKVGATRIIQRMVSPGAVDDATRTVLRIEASAMIIAGESEEDVTECVRLWLEKPSLGPRALKSLMAEVYKRRNNGGSQLAPGDEKALGWFTVGKES